jgi:hypothetical protein
MFDINSVNVDHFKINLDNNEVIDINPPKIKVLKKIMALTKVTDETAINEVSIALQMILNSNKQGKVFDDNYIDEKFTLQNMKEFLKEYFKWVSSIKNSPN